MLTSEELKKRGGYWIAAARSWIQRTFVNGETVVWGSDTILRGDISPRKIEELAELVVLAYANRDMPEIDNSEQTRKEFELICAIGHLAPTTSGRALVPVAVAEIKRMREDRENLIKLLEDARVFAATVAQSPGNSEAGKSEGTGVEWRGRADWANNLAMSIEQALSLKRLPNLPPEANARGGA